MTAPDPTAAATANEPILLHDATDGVATLTLNRPRAYNALSEELIDAVQAALDDVAEDGTTRVVVLAAAGKAFCAGHDLKEMRANPDRDYYRALFAKCSRMMTSIVELPQPVIASVQGIATAAGCQLVASCDLAVAADDARLATNGIANGLFCSTPSVALSRNIARKQAFEMLFTGEFVDAETARAMGLVNRVVPAAQLADGTMELARSVAEKSPVTLRSGKAMFYRQLGMELDEAYAFAAENMACDMMSDDAGEGIDAFIEKRKPEWTGK
jgi:enoyl-CoA hydratase/carnithine racemase